MHDPEPIAVPEEIQDVICWSTLSEFQKSVIKQRVEGVTYREIVFEGRSFYNRQISAALRNAALGVFYNPDEFIGIPYLNSEDMNMLVHEITDAWQNGTPYDSFGAIDAAYEYRLERYAKGVDFLTRIKSNDLADTLLEKKFDPPTRSWIHSLVKQTELYLRDRRNIKLSRITACAKTIFVDFFTSFGGWIRAVSPLLFFAADETMLDVVISTKVLVPGEMREAITPTVDQFPHISVMCAHSIMGPVLPPFMIFPDLTKLPQELTDLVDSGQIDVASAPSGYMSRDTFLFWVFNFINQIEVYRKTLPDEVAGNRGLLILDGHSSRACPIGLRLLHMSKFDVLIEPSNTSHVIQQFDVGLAAPMKSKFKDVFHLQERKDREGYQTNNARIRRHAAIAVISAWSCASTLSNRLSAAKATGMYPYNPEVVYNSRFVTVPTQLQQERQNERDERRHRGIDINSKIISDPVNVDAIIEKLKQNNKFVHLCNPPTKEDGSLLNYCEMINCYLKNVHNDSRMLSPIRPKLKNDGTFQKFGASKN